MDSELKLPFYAKATLIVIGLTVFVNVLYAVQGIIVPIIYSVILAIVLSPVVDFLQRKKINNILAIVFSIILLCVVAILLALVFYAQVNMFSDSFAKLLDKFSEVLNNLTLWASNYFNISVQNVNAYVANAKAEIISMSKNSVGLAISQLLRSLFVLGLIPVYVFMFLFYKPLLIEFIHKVFKEEDRAIVDEVLSSTKSIVQKYLIGLLIEAAIIATLNSLGLLIIGIDYAIILGITGAILNVIPYIGGVIAIALPMIIAAVTKDSITYPILVLGVYLFIQFIDNHYVIPKIVASKVKINALISIIVVLVGGALWGIPGMFLSIPLTAILKVIFDHIESLKPWGFLLGDTMPTISIRKLKFTSKKK